MKIPRKDRIYMTVPQKELHYFIGENYKKLKMSKLVEALQKAGVKVNGQMTLFELFQEVLAEYKRRTRGKS